MLLPRGFNVNPTTVKVQPIVLFNYALLIHQITVSVNEMSV